MKPSHISLYFILFIAFTSCYKQDHEINLKWNKGYENDTFERHCIGLKWALSYLGSTIANDTTLLGITYKDSTITLNIKQLGFSENAVTHLAKLQYIFKASEEYKKNNAMDIGRYIALTYGNSYHYYAITNVPKTLEQFERLYEFDSLKGYIDDSSVSRVDRIISYSKRLKNNGQGFVSAEIDSISKDTFEYETVEIMSNGQQRFGVYGLDGKLKEAADANITRAGKPAKCIWCHEVVVQPLFRSQQNHKGYLSYLRFKDSLKYYNQELQAYQNELWTDKSILNKALHTELELLYISFMEPTVGRLSREWNLPLTEVRQKLAHLKTHQHEEFSFLGNLYHRKDIDALAPFKAIKTPESIREQSANEINLLQ